MEYISKGNHTTYVASNGNVVSITVIAFDGKTVITQLKWTIVTYGRLYGKAEQRGYLVEWCEEKVIDGDKCLYYIHLKKSASFGIPNEIKPLIDKNIEFALLRFEREKEAYDNDVSLYDTTVIVNNAEL